MFLFMTIFFSLQPDIVLHGSMIFTSGLIQCYMALYRHREALTWAGKAIKTLGTTARTLTVSGGGESGREGVLVSKSLVGTLTKAR